MLFPRVMCSSTKNAPYHAGLSGSSSLSAFLTLALLAVELALTRPRVSLEMGTKPVHITPSEA